MNAGKRICLIYLQIATFYLWKESNAQEECMNARAQFAVKKVKYSCKLVRDDPSLCYKQKKFKRKCPVVCGTCECNDKEGPFISVVKGQMNCKRVANKREFLCTDRDARMYCPDTCGMCAESITVAPTPAPKFECSIEGTLENNFPNDANSSGVQSNSLIVKKKDVDEICQGGITSWGCFHRDLDSDPESESAQVINGAEGQFSFQVQHDADDGEDDEESERIPSTLDISVNGEPKASFDTGDDDLKVSVECDSFCNCVIEKEEVCSLYAELGYPEDPGYFGYHKDDVSVTKLGTDEVCNSKSLSETSWGCSHTGDAVIWNPEDLITYYKYNHDETVDITDMRNSTVYMDVRHFFHTDYEAYYDYDHRIRATLSVSINNEHMGNFTTPKNTNRDTHLSDGSINEAYVGDYRATVTCDNQCNCNVMKRNY